MKVFGVEVSGLKTCLNGSSCSTCGNVINECECLDEAENCANGGWSEKCPAIKELTKNKANNIIKKDLGKEHQES